MTEQAEFTAATAQMRCANLEAKVEAVLANGKNPELIGLSLHDGYGLAMSIRDLAILLAETS